MLHCHQLTVNLRFTLTGCPWPVNCKLTIWLTIHELKMADDLLTLFDKFAEVLSTSERKCRPD